MFNYVIRRLLYAVPILAGVIAITFLLFNVLQTPDAAATLVLGPKATQAARAEWIKNRGLDLPLPVQLKNHVVKLVTFQFGTSWKTGRDLGEVFAQGAGPSLLITVPGFLAGLIGGVGLALYQVFVRNSPLDKSLTLLAVGLMSIPTVVYIIFLQAVGALMLNYFPASGFDWRGLGTIRFVALPIIIMAIINLGYDMRLYRAIFMEEIGQDYVRTAFAKGASSGRVLGVHVFKNGLIALITLTVAHLPKLIMGSLLIENFFGIPGLGNVLVMAIQTGDQPVVMASVFLGSLLYIASLILTDICYALADPRIRLS
jgi:peptide/nickel transport system permease protein